MCECKVVRKFVGRGIEKLMHSLCPTNKAKKHFLVCVVTFLVFLAHLIVCEPEPLIKFKNLEFIFGRREPNLALRGEEIQI